MFRSPYAVDSDVFQPNPLGREGARRMLGVSRDRFLLMFSGKLIPGKNPRLVLQALERMPERSRISFLVVGDGPLRAQLEREGRRILGGNILFAGFQNQSRLSTFYQAADAFVLPSEYETWGLVVNEAMRFGLPAVVSDRAGCAADLVQDGHTGLLFRSGDAAGLAAALRRLVASPSFRAECGRNAAALIERYTPDQAANGILEALQSGVGAKRLQRQRTPPSCRSAYTA
jgi:glycosyltransferase involved in cell wall biosynthesis